MKKNNTAFFFLLLTLSFLFSCGHEEKWYRTKSGLLYKVIPSGSKDTVRMGMTVKLNCIQRVGDSIMDNTYDKMPLYWMVFPRMSYYNPLEVFDYVQCVGDSIVTRQLVDSMLAKKIFTKMPPWMKKEDEWVTSLKVENVFLSDSLLQLDKIKAQQKADSLQRIEGAQRVEKWMEANQPGYKKYEPGIYISTVQEGTGAMPDSGNYIGIRYRITNLKGKIFDTNMDTAFHHPDTLQYVLNSPFMLHAVDAGIRHMRKGEHAYIGLPAMQVFGGHPPQGSVLHPYDDLVAEIYLLDIKEQAPVAQRTPKK